MPINALEGSGNDGQAATSPNCVGRFDIATWR